MRGTHAHACPAWRGAPRMGGYRTARRGCTRTYHPGPGGEAGMLGAQGRRVGGCRGGEAEEREGAASDAATAATAACD